MAAPQVQEDLQKNHGRTCSRSMVRDLADVVASIAQAKEEKWSYDIPPLPAPVQTIAIGPNKQGPNKINRTATLLTTPKPVLSSFKALFS